MKLIFSFLFTVAVLIAATAQAQTFEVPANYELKQAADYARYEKDVIAAAKWLKETSLNEQTEKRKEVSAFVVAWINGSPTVNVEINEILLDFDKKNNGMLVLYMAGCARYVLENNDPKDMRAKQKAALRDMMDVYKAGKGIKKDKKMDKLIKADEDGKFDEWLEENLKINPR